MKLKLLIFLVLLTITTEAEVIFIPPSDEVVSITLTCTSGIITENPLPSSSAAPAVFEIIGADPGTTCTAIEDPVPEGYILDMSDCQDGDPIGGSCIMINTLDELFISGFEAV